MKPIDQWSDSDIVDATFNMLEVRGAIEELSKILDYLPNGVWEEGVGRYNALTTALDALFGEDWLQWLDVDTAPSDTVSKEWVAEQVEMNMPSKRAKYEPIDYDVHQ